MDGNGISDGAGRVDRLVLEPERRAITGVSRTTAWRLERRGEYPCRRQITPHLVGWSANELQAWIEARPKVQSGKIAP